MKKGLLLLSIVITLFTACKKDAVDYTEFGGTNTGTTTGSSVTTVTVNPAYNYQPVKEGTFWKYTYSGATSDVTTAIMLNTTKVFDGRSYFVGTSKLASEDKAGSVYFYNRGDIYSERDVDIDNETTEIIYLRTDLPVDGTWNAAEYYTDPADAGSKVTGRIVEKGISRTVNNKKFNDVIHTNILIQASDPTSSKLTTVGNYDYYVAKGVGIIEQTANVFGITITAKLTDFQIK